MRGVRPVVGLLAAAAMAAAVVAGQSADMLASGHSTTTARAYAESVGHTSADVRPNLRDGRGKIVSKAKVYTIFWGQQTDFPSDTKSAMPRLFGGLNGSGYLATIDEYMRGGTASVTYVRSFDDPSAAPTVDPTPQVILAEVRKVLRRAHVAADTNAVYLVFSSTMPNVDYCAWHASGFVQGIQTQVAYIPNSAASSTCYPTDNYTNVTPYSFGTRSLADNATHELLEAMTDPVPGTSWVDAQSNEVGDKCDFIYSTPVVLGGASSVWQLQSQWSNRSHSCVQQSTVSAAKPVAPPHKRRRS